MREIRYRNFSLKTHRKNWQTEKPNVCQFELTFGCGLHCWHCYSDCYNQATYIKNELNTKEVKYILDKVYQAGVIWLCFTGGDPLIRKDFLDIYSYAKLKGFIITIFTNAYSMTEKIAQYLRKRPPFVIEMTLNAVTEELYEKISGVKGSFVKIMNGINIILKAGLPLKIKTQVTQDNLKELPKIKRFIQGLGLKFQPSYFLHARLNGDRTPCNLRIALQQVLSLDRKKPLTDDCFVLSDNPNQQTQTSNPYPEINLFNCTIGDGDGIYLDPYGNLVPCNCLRKSRVNLLKEDIREARKKILNWVSTRRFDDNSKCKVCALRNFCFNCPGKALLEKGRLAGRIDWFCKLAYLSENKVLSKPPLRERIL